MKIDEEFVGVDYSDDRFPLGEFDSCIFRNCNFSNVILSNREFVDCEFINCNLSNVELVNTAFKEVSFDNCKIVGVDFSKCNPFLLQFTFESCQLRYAQFYQLELIEIVFRNCNLQEVDFTETNLTKAVFDHCDLMKAVFEKSNLEQSDFYSSVNYRINPEFNKLRKAIFSKEGVLGLLESYQISIKE